jgi:hypothetical protein
LFIHFVLKYRYNETGKSEIVNVKPHHVFALHRSGYLIWVEVTIREFSSSVAQMLASSGMDATESQVRNIHFVYH